MKSDQINNSSTSPFYAILSGWKWNDQRRLGRSFGVTHFYSQNQRQIFQELEERVGTLGTFGDVHVGPWRRSVVLAGLAWGALGFGGHQVGQEIWTGW